MPIRGLSDKRRFSRGGKIRLGEKRVNDRGKEYPDKLDHFLFDPDDKSLIPLFNDLFGEPAKRITIAFASDDIEKVFPQYYKCYGASGLLCKGDGECALRQSKDGQLVEVECPGPFECDFSMSRGIGGAPGCNSVGSLQFFIPDLPVMQVFQIDTKSYNSIVNMNSALEILKKVAGRLSFVPVDLVLKPQSATIPKTGKKTVIYVLDLVIPVSLRNARALRPLLAYDGAEAPPPSDALPDDLYARSQVRALPEPDPGETVDPETGEITPDPEPEPEAPSLANDADVLAAFEAAGVNGAKRQAMLLSADSGQWSKEQLLAVIRKNGQAQAAPQPRQPQNPQPQQQPPAKAAPNGNGRRGGALF